MFLQYFVGFGEHIRPVVKGSGGLNQKIVKGSAQFWTGHLYKEKIADTFAVLCQKITVFELS